MNYKTKSLASELKVDYILKGNHNRTDKRTAKAMSETGKKCLVFISHSHLDTWVAKQIAAKLEAEDIETFLDQLHIAAGEDFEARIIQALYEADELVALFTPWGQASKFVWMEIGAAWYKKIPIIPVLYGVTVNDLITPPDFPIVLKKRDMITLDQIEDYITQLKKKLSTKS